MIKTAALATAVALPLGAAGTSTAHFYCALDHGGIAVFDVQRGNTEGFAHFHKPSGGQWILHLGSHRCTAIGGCYVGARAAGRKGYKLDTIVEHSMLPVILEMHKCL